MFWNPFTFVHFCVGDRSVTRGIANILSPSSSSYFRFVGDLAACRVLSLSWVRGEFFERKGPQLVVLLVLFVSVVAFVVVVGGGWWFVLQRSRGRRS